MSRPWQDHHRVADIVSALEQFRQDKEIDFAFFTMGKFALQPIKARV